MRSTVATLRQRARILAAAAVLGLAAGIAYVLILPPPLTSTAIVLLPTPALADSSSSDVDTQVRIALSTTVLEQAGQTVTPSLTARQVEKMIKITAPTDQLVQIDATSTDATQAQTLAQAVADSYVGYVSNTAREVTAAALADLKQRKDALQTQINQLQTEIDATMTRQRGDDPRSAQAREEAQLLAGLRTQQANLSLQLDKVDDKIATGAPTTQASGAGTSVIQQATVATGPLDADPVADLGAAERPGGRDPDRGRPADRRSSRRPDAVPRRHRRRGRQPRAGRRSAAGRRSRSRAGRPCSAPTRRLRSSPGPIASSLRGLVPSDRKGELRAGAGWIIRRR